MGTRDDEDGKVLSENTPIKVGLLITLAGFLFGAVWWAASMHSKVDQLVELGRAHAIADSTQNSAINAMENRIHTLEKFGSDPVVQRVSELERKMSDSERRIGGK
jgi:hypothetical protein